MKKIIRITTAREEMQEGLFGQIFLWVFEILPYLDRHGILPAWAIRSELYGVPEDFIVIPGLLELNYDAGSGNAQDVNLLDLREWQVATLGGNWEYNSRLWCKYFRWPERVIRRADKFPSLNQALGLHYRGTDKNRSLAETNCVSPEDFLALVKDFVATHPDLETIYVASDEPAFAESVRSQHPALSIYDSGPVMHHKLAAEDNFARADHALLDCLLLSRCRYLLKCQSALSGFAKILNPKLEAYRISANKLAPWCYGIPYFPDAFLPRLTSQNPECQKILARLLAGDWTENRWAVKKFGGVFRYKKRRRRVRKSDPIPALPRDGLPLRLGTRLASLARQLGAKSPMLI